MQFHKKEGNTKINYMEDTMGSFDEFDLDIIQTTPTASPQGATSIFSTIIACSIPCITETTCFSPCSDNCSQKGCTTPDTTCGTGCQVTLNV